MMRPRLFRAAALLCLLVPGLARAEVLIRWDQEEVPPRQGLGISTLVLPASSRAAIARALAAGYRVYLELDAAQLAAFKPPAGVSGVVLRGQTDAKQRRLLEQRLTAPGARVLTLDERGKWPHVRTNWVTRNKDVLQVSGRSAQPWIENNAALIAIDRAAGGDAPAITYPWQPITLSDADEGPALENYLVAIAEAGSFGADLLLPLHARLQRSLLLGEPRARAWWAEMRRAIEFYSWDLVRRYRPTVNVAVVTAQPAAAFEVMNLLARHNLSFDVVDPVRLPSLDLSRFALLIVPDAPQPPQVEALSAFARGGGTVVITAAGAGQPWTADPAAVKTGDRTTYQHGSGRVVEAPKGIADPNVFALDMRQLLGRERRVIDVWNGITVLTAAYETPDGASALVTALNYAHQPLPVQLRVRGIFSVVHFESPEQPLALIPYEHRDGYTEFVLPALRVGGRVFLSQKQPVTHR